MPTYINFQGGAKLEVEEDYDKVVAGLIGDSATQLTRFAEGGQEVRVRVYRDAIAYVQERKQTSSEPMVAVG